MKYRNYTLLYDTLYQMGYHGGRKNFGQNYIKHLIRNFDFSSVLDIGCSQGVTVKTFQNKGKKANGIDISKVAINRSKQLGIEGCSQGDVTNIRFKDDSFDLVFTCDVLEHLRPKDVDKAINEIIRIAKKYIFIKVSPVAEFNRNFLNKLHKENKFEEVDNLHLTLMSMKKWVSKFTRRNKFVLHTLNKRKQFFIMERKDEQSSSSG